MQIHFFNVYYLINCIAAVRGVVFHQLSPTSFTFDRNFSLIVELSWRGCVYLLMLGGGVQGK